MYDKEYTPSLSVTFTNCGDNIDPRVRTNCNTNTARTRWNSKGVLERVPANTPRIGYHINSMSPLGLMSEQQRTNWCTNGEMVGSTPGTIGSGGALPTSFSQVDTGGLTWTLTTVSTDSKGVRVLDLTLQGIATSTTCELLLEASTSAVCAVSQRWTGSLLVTVPSGTTEGVNNQGIKVTQRTSIGTAVTASVNYFTPSTVHTVYESKMTMGVGTERVTHSFTVECTVGASVSATYRLGLVQLERGFGASSFIPTSVSTVTRPDEINYISNIQDYLGVTEGTVLVEYIAASVDTSAAVAPTLFTLMNSTNTSFARVAFSLTNRYPNMTLASSGVTKVNTLSSVSMQVSCVGRIGIAFKPTGTCLISNAVTSNAFYSSTGLATSNLPYETLYIGSRQSSVSANLNGTITQIVVYPNYMDSGEISQFTRDANKTRGDYT